MGRGGSPRRLSKGANVVLGSQNPHRYNVHLEALLPLVPLSPTQYYVEVVPVTTLCSERDV